MGKVLVIQGAGMNMRGKVQLETFGPMTLREMNEQIVGYGKELDMDIELIEVHASNPTSRGTVSQIQPVCKGSVYGFGIYGYKLALEAIKSMR